MVIKRRDISYKISLFERIVPLLCAWYLQGRNEKTGEIAEIDNVIIMKLFYFFVVVGDLVHIFNNFYAYPNGPVEEDAYLHLLENPNFLQEKYYEALKEVANLPKKTDRIAITGFTNAAKDQTLEILNKLEELGIFRESRDGLIQRSHGSGTWLTAFLKSGGIKHQMRSDKLQEESADWNSIFDTTGSDNSGAANNRWV